MTQPEYDQLKGPYNIVNSYSNNSIFKDYTKYCNNQLLNPEPNKPHIKGEDSEKAKNLLENQQTFYTSVRTSSEGIIGSINEENEPIKREGNQVPNNFNDLPIEHPDQQVSNLGNILNIESNNFHPQTTHKAKKLIFNVITPIPKKNKTIEINIREKNEEKKEIPSKIKKTTSLFKTEKVDCCLYDNNSYLITKLKIDNLIDDNFVRKGRISQIKKALGVKGKHNENSMDNLENKIFNKCMNSFDKEFIKNECKKYNYPIVLKDIGIKKQLKRNFIDYNIFCNKTLYEIYIHSFPKNMKKSQKLKIINDGNNINEEAKVNINQLINLEKNNKKAETKILYLLFKKTIFYVILNAFLFDRNIIIVDGTEIELKGFKTYKDYFNGLTSKRRKN